MFERAKTLLHLVEDIDAATKQYLAMLGEFSALRVAIEQPHPERAFHFGYRLLRRRDVKSSAWRLP